MKLLHIAGAVAFGIAAPIALHAAGPCPAFGSATAGCDIIITVTDSGTTVAAGPSLGIAGGTYDGADDSLIGIVNNSSSPLSSTTLTSTTNAFGFEADGIDTYGAPKNSSDTSGYGGPDSFFTALNLARTAGTVNFVTPLAANGGSTYFSLEEALVPSQILPSSATPEPGTLALLGTGLAAFAGTIRRRLAQ